MLLVVRKGDSSYFVYTDSGVSTHHLSTADSAAALAHWMNDSLSGSSAQPLSGWVGDSVPITGNAGLNVTEDVDCRNGLGTLHLSNDLQRWCAVYRTTDASTHLLTPAAGLVDIASIDALTSDLLPDHLPDLTSSTKVEFPAFTPDDWSAVCSTATAAIVSHALHADYVPAVYYVSQRGNYERIEQSRPSAIATVEALDLFSTAMKLIGIVVPSAETCGRRMAQWFGQTIEGCIDASVPDVVSGETVDPELAGCFLSSLRDLYHQIFACAIGEAGSDAARAFLEAIDEVFDLWDGGVVAGDLGTGAYQVLTHDVAEFWSTPTRDCRAIDLPVPVATRNGQIPADVTYHRIYDFTAAASCTTCQDDSRDPLGHCVPPGFELTYQRVATTDEQSLTSDHYSCTSQPAGADICLKNFECFWSHDGVPDSCHNTTDGEAAPATPSCVHTPGTGLLLTVPAGTLSSSGYDVGLWPKEPIRPAFKAGKSMYAYAQFYLPCGSSQGARVGADCTPDEDPNSRIIGQHVPASTSCGRWQEMLLPVDPAVGYFTTIPPDHDHCSAWAQCLNAGLWPPEDGDAAGGSCLIARFEVAGYLERCTLDQNDIVIEVDNCSGCTLGHEFTRDGGWVDNVPGTTNGAVTSWRFSAPSTFSACLRTTPLNIQLASGEWAFDGDGYWNTATQQWVQTGAVVRKTVRAKIVAPSGTVLEQTTLGCDSVRQNQDSSGHPSNGFLSALLISPSSIAPAGDGAVCRWALE